MKTQILLFLYSILLLQQFYVPVVVGYGESDASGHPNYQERANHVFMNAVRISPSQYKTVYMAGYSPSPAAILGSAYPARPPVYLEPKLVSAAYAHSNDMATNGCFSHNSCDGTPTFTRIGSYYSCSGYMGENIAAGNADPLDTNNQWLCDQVGSACAADGSSSDGHRSNIMSGSYKVVGTGYAYTTSSYRHYWTQDFGGASCAPAPTSPIYGGSHRTKSGTTRFVVVYYTNPAVAPASATVTIAGTSNPLALDLGAAGAGTYFFSQTAGTGCRSYYFTFGTYRYPETGCLVTYGEGTCTTSFDATCGGTTSGSAAAVAASSSGIAATTTAKSATTGSVATTTTKSVSTTTAKSTTTGSASATTGSGSGSGDHNLYTSSLQNGWVIQANSGATLTHSFTYSGITGLRAVLTSTTTNNNFIMFNHNPAVTNVWTSVRFSIAASANRNFIIFFNGCYTQTRAITTAWQTITIPLTSLGDPQNGGNPVTIMGGSTRQLVFRNTATSSITLYLSNVAFV